MKETLKSQPYNHADDFDISLCQDKMVEKLENSFVNHFHTISPVYASLDFKLSFPFSKFLTFLLNHLKKKNIYIYFYLKIFITTPSSLFFMPLLSASHFGSGRH